MGWLRSAVGVALVTAPRAPMRLAGQEPTTADTLVMRTIGIRDLVLGLGTVAAARAGDGGDTSGGGLSDRADRAATLLGAAHGVRGGADSGHPDVAAVTAAARDALGLASFDRRYADGQGLSRGEAVSFAIACLPWPGRP